MTTLTDDELIIEALRARARQRQRASTQLSTALADARAEGKDVRSGALKVIDELAYAARLGAIADSWVTTSNVAALVAVPLLVVEEPAAEILNVDGLGAVDVLPDHGLDEDDDTIIEVDS